MSVEKKLTFCEKIDIILYIKELTIKDLEKEWGKNGTIYKAYEENRDFQKRLMDEFLLKFNIKKSWWKNPVGNKEEDVFEKKVTPMPKIEQPAIFDDPVVQGLKREIGHLNKIIKMQEDEIRRLRGGE